MSFRQSGQDIYPFAYNQSYAHQSYLNDGSDLCAEDSNFWTTTDSPRSDAGSPSIGVVGHPYQSYSIPFNSNDICSTHYRSEADSGRTPGVGVPFVRVVKRRTTANKKERRRTQSINSAYEHLRHKIPNVPADTKLSKIKTLRLATSYISYLTAVLETNQPAENFKVELNNIHSRRAAIHSNECSSAAPESDAVSDDPVNNSGRRGKGRTGWPQHVWALELKQEQSL